MDVQLSSDVLDLSFHPAEGSPLLVAGLISGKIQLLDYSKLVRRTEERSGSNEGEEDDEGAVGSSIRQGKARRTDDESEEEEESEDSDSDASLDAQGQSAADRMYTRPWAARPSSKSCRGVAFDAVDGSSIWSISKDGSICKVDTETGSIVSSWKGAHAAAPSRILPISSSMVATGDDDGIVALWDPRRPSTAQNSAPSLPSSSGKSDGGASCLAAGAVRSYAHHFDWITSLLHMPNLAPPKQKKKTKEEIEKEKRKEEKRKRKKARKGNESDDGDALLAEAGRERIVVTSGDGSLSVIDPRAGPSAVEVSEDQEDELLSIAAIKGGSKLLVGTQLGMLSLWAPSRGLLDHVDRIPGHPSSVDALCTLDDDTVLSGSSDGLVRVVQVLPHKLLGVIADHGGLPVERIVRKGRWVGSVGHGPVVFTDVGALLEEDSGEEDDKEEEDSSDEQESEDAQPAMAGDLSGSFARPGRGEDEDVEEADAEEEDSESESEDSDAKIQAPPKKKARQELLNAQGSRREEDDFFSGF